MKINDEKLLAYVDGQLSTRESQALEHAMGIDEALSAELESMLNGLEAIEKNAATTRTQVASRPVLVENTGLDLVVVTDESQPKPVIPTLDLPVSNAACTTPSPSADIAASPLADIEPAPTKGLWTALRGGVLSLTLMLTALGVGVFYAQPIQGFVQTYLVLPHTSPQIAATELPLLTTHVSADQPLYQALQSASANELFYLGGDGELVMPVLSFQAADGRYCRQFELNSGLAVSLGVACQQGDFWEIKVLLAAGERMAGQTAYQVAAGYSHNALNAVLDGLWSGAALTAEQEYQLIMLNWRSL